MWKLIKTAMLVVGAIKLLGYKTVRNYAKRRLLSKGLKFLPL